MPNRDLLSGAHIDGGSTFAICIVARSKDFFSVHIDHEVGSLREQSQSNGSRRNRKRRAVSIRNRDCPPRRTNGYGIKPVKPYKPTSSSYIIPKKAKLIRSTTGGFMTESDPKTREATGKQQRVAWIYRDI